MTREIVDQNRRVIHREVQDQRLVDRLGICQWFHYQDHQAVTDAVEWMRDLGVRHLRTGISWADFHRPGGQAWYDWQMEQLAEFDVLLSIWHTPPSRAEGGAACNAPPRRLWDYADFIGQVINLYGHRMESLELWNEPNNHLKWDFRQYDPHWEKFGAMIREAGRVAQDRNVRTVLGGIIPVDHHWLNLIDSYGALEGIDVVAIHAFPEMWWSGDICWDWERDWHGWQHKVQYIAGHAGGRPIWCTETGLATWDLENARPARRAMQRQKLLEAATAPVGRLYWYCLQDLDPRRAAIEGFHVDENEYHLGLVTHDGQRKPAYDTFQELMQGPSPETVAALRSATQE